MTSKQLERLSFSGFSSGDVAQSLWADPSSSSASYGLAAGAVVHDDGRGQARSFASSSTSSSASGLAAMCVAPSGQLVAGGQRASSDATGHQRVADVVVWDAQQQRVLFRFEEHRGDVLAMAFSHCSRFLATAGADGQLYVFDMQSGLIVANAAAPATSALAWGGRRRDAQDQPTTDYVLCTLSASTAAAGLHAQSRRLLFWVLDPRTGRLASEAARLGKLGRERAFTCLAFSPDGRFVVCGSQSGDVSIFQTRGRVYRGGFDTVPGAGSVTSVLVGGGGVVWQQGRPGGASSPASSSLHCFVGAADGSVTLFVRDERSYNASVDDDANADAGVFVDALQCRTGGGAVTSLSMAGDGLSILCGTATCERFRLGLKQAGRAVSLRGGSHTHIQMAHRGCDFDLVCLGEHHWGAVRGVAFSDDGRQFATAGDDGSVRLWDASTCRVTGRLQTDAQSRQQRVLDANVTVPTCLVWVGDDVVTGWSDGALRCHAAKSGAARWSIANAQPGGVSALAVTPSLAQVVTGGGGGMLRVWDVRTQRLVHQCKEGHKGHEGVVSSIAVFADNKHCVSSNLDGSFQCWDLESGRRLTSHVQRLGALTGIAVGARQDQVVTVGHGRLVSLWDLREPEARSQLLVSTAATVGPTQLAASRRTDVYATAGPDRVVRLWRLPDARAPAAPVPRLTGQEPRDVVERELRRQPAFLAASGPAQQAAGDVHGLAFSPDGRQLVSVGADGVAVWSVA